MNRTGVFTKIKSDPFNLTQNPLIMSDIFSIFPEVLMMYAQMKRFYYFIIGSLVCTAA